MVKCPECDASVGVEESTLAGEIIECADCGAELEVKKTNPFVLTLAPQEEEDWGQ